MSGTDTSDNESVAAPRFHRGHGAKVAKPDFFTGERTKLETWLLQLDMYFRFDGKRVDEVSKATFATTYMRGQAELWIKPYLRIYMAGDNVEGDEVTQIFSTWAGFKAKLRSVFGITHEAAHAERMIQKLRQEKSAAEYATQFQ